MKQRTYSIVLEPEEGGGDGRLEEAEVLARRSHDWSRLLTGRDPSGVYGIQMFSIRRELGRLAGRQSR